MGYSVENNGSQRYKLTSEQEVVSSAEGQDYTITHVESKLGKFATVRGRIYQPESSDIKVVNLNGFMATASVYDEVAAEMATMGATTAVYDTWHPLTLKDLKDPMIVASMGGHRMIDIMEDLTGEATDVAAIGHSMGGLTSSRLAAHDPRVNYWIGDASAGIEHTDMLKVHIDNMSEILHEEALPLGKYVVNKVGIRNLAKEYGKRIALNPTQIARQAFLLCHNPDIAPFLAKAKQHGVMTGVLLHEHDKFFHQDKQLKVIERKSDLFDVVEKVPGTKHVHSSMAPRENAELRMNTIRRLQAGRYAISAFDTAVGH